MMTFSDNISALPKVDDAGILHLVLNLHPQKSLGKLDLEGSRGCRWASWEEIEDISSLGAWALEL